MSTSSESVSFFGRGWSQDLKEEYVKRFMSLKRMLNKEFSLAFRDHIWELLFNARSAWLVR